jgi:hypothetical protein
MPFLSYWTLWHHRESRKTINFRHLLSLFYRCI